MAFRSACGRKQYRNLNLFVRHALLFVLHVAIMASSNDSQFLSTQSLAEALSAKVSTSKKFLVVDFDGTCTVMDTTPMLPKLAALMQNGKETTNVSTLDERLETFSALEQEYHARYKQAKNDLNHVENIPSLFEALERLDDVSNVVTAKVTASGVLSGLKASLDYTQEMTKVLDNHSLQIQLQKQCGRVLYKVHASEHCELRILSINWCPSLISACLQPHLPKDKEPPFIWSNMVDHRNGKVLLQIPGALAKQKRILELKQSDCLVVYVGDSSTDLAALLEADVGILFCGSESTMNIAKQAGVCFLSLSKLKTHKKKKNVIWTTDCWSDIEALVESKDEREWFL